MNIPQTEVKYPEEHWRGESIKPTSHYSDLDNHICNVEKNKTNIITSPTIKYLQNTQNANKSIPE